MKPDTKKTKTDKANTDKEFNMSEGKETSNQRIRNKPSTREVIREFLKREGKTVTYDEIYNYTVSKVRLTTKTPRNSIYSVLIRMDDVKHVGTGQYKFKGK